MRARNDKYRMASPLRIFFVLSFALTWGVGGLALLIGLCMPESRPLATSSLLYYLAAYSVSLTGIVLTARYEGREGLRRLGRRLLPWRSLLRWYLIVAVGYGAITVITLSAAALGQPTAPAFPPWYGFLTTLVIAIVQDPGPIGEEFGWRGFALPRLLERYTPLGASIILGLIHAAWHIPLFFIPGMPQTQVSFPLFTLGVVSIAVFNTALYLRTGANLLLAILVHLLANVCGGFALDAHALNVFFAAEGVAAALVVFVGGLRSTIPSAPTTSDPAVV
jgi:membrane protease YdiL (CAAX protease family)